MSKNDRIIETIEHYKRNIVRVCPENEELLDPKKVLYCLEKLSKLPINIHLLQITGIGRTVNELRKYDGVISEKAKIVVTQWKAAVKAEEDKKEYEDGDNETGKENGHEDHESIEEEIENRDVNGRDNFNNSSGTSSDEDEEESNAKNSDMQHVEDTQDDIRTGEVDSEEESEDEKERRLKFEEEKKVYEEYLKSKRKKAATNGHHKENSDNFSKDKEGKSDWSKESSDKNRECRSDYKKENVSRNDKDKIKDKKDVDKYRNEKYDKSREKEKERSNHDKSRDRHSSSKSKDQKENQSDKNNRNKERSSDKKEKEKYSEEIRIKKGNSDVDGKKNHDKYNNSKKNRDSEKELKKNGEHDRNKGKSHSSSSSRLREEKPKRKHEEEKVRESKKTRYDNIDGVRVKREPTTDEDSNNSSSPESFDCCNYSSGRSSRESSIASSGAASSVISIKKEKSESPSSSSSSHSKKHSSSGSSSSSSRSENQSESKKAKIIDTDVGFGDALMGIPSSYKSPKKKSATLSKKPEQKSHGISKDKGRANSKDKSREGSRDVSRESSPLLLLSSKVKLEPLEKLDIDSTLPEISPDNYFKPHLYQYNDKPSHAVATHDELCAVMTSKNQRTKVFSGSRNMYTKLPSLYEMCIRILQENIDALEYTGGVPYDILKPILERATAEQLYQLEHYNPYLIEDTGPHWKFHCNKEFRGKILEEYETWRELYLRCLFEREKKFQKIRQNINLSKKQSLPVRQTKLAYVDVTFAKPPRNVARQQARYGTGSSSSSSSIPSKADIVAKATVGGYSNLGKNETAVKVAPVKPSSSGLSVSTGSSNNPLLKKKKAPLMMKALQSFKGFRNKR